MANVIGEGEGRAPNSLIFFLASLAPPPFPRCILRVRTVSLSAERVLESLELKGDGNDGMSSGKESENVRIKARGLKHQYETQENKSGAGLQDVRLLRI